MERAQRFPIKLSLRYRKIGTTSWLLGSTLNLSRTGVLFQAERSYPIQTTLEMRIRFPMAVMACKCAVVRVQIAEPEEAGHVQMAALIKHPMLTHLQIV